MSYACTEIVLCVSFFPLDWDTAFTEESSVSAVEMAPPEASMCVFSSEASDLPLESIRFSHLPGNPSQLKDPYGAT